MADTDFDAVAGSLNNNIGSFQYVNKSIKTNANGEATGLTFTEKQLPLIGIENGWFYLFAKTGTNEYRCFTAGGSGSNVASRPNTGNLTVPVLCYVLP